MKAVQPLLALLAAILLLLSACGDSDETKAQRLLTQAEASLQQGHPGQAEQVLRDLVANYPKTQSAQAAGEELLRIQKKRALQEYQEGAARVLGSFQQVLDGFRSLYAEYPRSIAAFDQSDYFFDSAYLKEITPDDYQVYFLLHNDGNRYRLWCIADGKESGYSFDSLNRQLVRFEREQTLAEIKAGFQAIAWHGKLVALQENK